MRKLYTLLFISFVSFSFAQVFTANYTFANVTITSGATDPTPVPTVSGLSFGSFLAVNTNTAPTNSSTGGRFSFINQPLGASDGSNDFASYSGALNPNIYYQVTITPNSGTVYNLTGITFKIQRLTSGVRNYAVRSNLDNYGANLSASINPANTNLDVVSDNIFFYKVDNNTAQTGSTVTLSGASFTGLTGPITLRFYGFNAEQTGGTFSVDDVAITGEVTTLSSTSFDEIEGLKMYPNPLNGSELFFTSSSNADKSVQIFDLVGKEVLKSNVINNTINIPSINAGVYIVKIIEDGKTSTRKLIIQ